MNFRPLALLTALALVLAACGGDSDDAAPATTEATTTTTTTTADDGATTTTSAAPEQPDGERIRFGDIALQRQSEESARFEGVLTIVGAPGSDLPGPIEILMSGATDMPNDASTVSIDMSRIVEAALAGEGGEAPPGFEQLFEEPLEVITIGDTSYMRWALLAMMTGAETEWVQLPPDDTGNVTGQFGLGSAATSPTQFLDQLADAETEVEVLGQETIRDQETTHYRMLVDVEQLSQDLTPEERAQLEQDLGTLDQAMPIELWIGDDGRLYRYSFETSNPEQPEVESVTAVIDVFDHGAELDIEPPPADQVTPMDDLGGGLSVEN